MDAFHIEDLKKASLKMTGSKRRAFQAEISLKYCMGSPRQTEKIFGWNRNTVELGLNEKQIGIICLGAKKACCGNKLWEEKHPEVAAVLFFITRHTTANITLWSDIGESCNSIGTEPSLWIVFVRQSKIGITRNRLLASRATKTDQRCIFGTNGHVDDNQETAFPIRVDLRRLAEKNIPACLSFHPSSTLGVSTHSPTMRKKARLEYE
ncbi:hypothetical protein [Desulfosarcina ovata]|uniref:hypothetical protein n=1 Tax=Desulfosarcina ovata TaxID=83564 RepID=UPI0012D2B79A|nr:hypothetical protein [Desulfosarcina ovata]